MDVEITDEDRENFKKVSAMPFVFIISYIFWILLRYLDTLDIYFLPYQDNNV